MPRWAKYSLFAVGGVVGLIVVAAAGLYASSSMKTSKTYDVPLVEVAIPADSASIERGKHLATAIGKCIDCHSDDFGGSVFIDDPGLGRLIASNLTRGGVGKDYTDAEMVRAIRRGVKRDNTGARIMPSEDYQYFSDEDVGALVAYIRSLPDVTRDLPPSELRPLGIALTGAGILPLISAEKVDQTHTPPATMVADTSLEYGKYLANVGGCTGCHGPGLSGGKAPGTPPTIPPAANLTPSGIGHYTDEQLENILRTGKRPDGSQVDDFMPWRATALMTDVEMRATIMYLRSVPAREYGNR